MTISIHKYSSYTDGELLSLIQQRNETAFECLYNRYFSILCHKAFKRIPDQQLIKEIVQDVFMNLWLKADNLNPAECVAAYLYATLRNKILHELRSRYTRLAYAEKISILYKSWLQSNAADPLEVKQLEEKLDLAISSLPNQCRDAFILSRYEDLSYKEIALYMNISLNTVKKHISKALKILRSKLNEYELVTILILLSLAFIR